MGKLAPKQFMGKLAPASSQQQQQQLPFVVHVIVRNSAILQK